MGITLTAINVYPVKGLKGIALDSALCTDRGIEHDRRWMVVDAEGMFISQRSHPKMATVWTDLTDNALLLSAPDEDGVAIAFEPPPAPAIKVQVWNSIVDAIPASREADLWLSSYLEFPCRLVYMPRDSIRYSGIRYAGEGKKVGFADGYAYMVIGEASLVDLNERLAAKNHPSQFRRLGDRPLWRRPLRRHPHRERGIPRREALRPLPSHYNRPIDWRSDGSRAVAHARGLPRQPGVRADVRDEHGFGGHRDRAHRRRDIFALDN
jgi:MOSC N-terminal beta barrel domain